MNFNALWADRPSHHRKLWVSCLNWSFDTLDQLSPVTALAIFTCSTTSVVGLLRIAKEQLTTWEEGKPGFLFQMKSTRTGDWI